MINILIIEDDKATAIMLKKYITKYMVINNVKDYQVDTATNGLDGVNMTNQTKYNMVFLDVIMPKYDGFDVLNDIRIKKKEQHQPYICMTTAMGEKEDIALFKQYGATSYAIKPYNKNTIYTMLDNYVKPLFEIVDTQVDEKFDNFTDFYNLDNGFSDYFYFDEEYCSSDKKISAIEFLNNSDNTEYILKDLNETDELLINLITYLDLESIEDFIKNINFILDKYITFLNGLNDFNQLSSSLSLLNTLIFDIDFNILENKKAICVVELVRAILTDLSLWKQSVFIMQNGVDIFYINTSTLNIYTQLENLIKIK